MDNLNKIKPYSMHQNIKNFITLDKSTSPYYNVNSPNPYFRKEKIRNYGSSLWAMIAMMGGFVTNIILDYLFTWSYNWGMKGAAFVTIIGQGVTMMITILYAVHKRKFFCIHL